MRWLVSDLHFGHKNIIHLQHRPYKSVEEMDQSIIDQWNSQVAKGDFVYVIGDFSFHNYKQTKAIIDKLNGQIVLIRGNHDERFTTHTFITMGIHDVYDYLVIKLGGIRVLMSHYPYRETWYKTVWKKLTGRFYYRRYSQYFLKDMGMPLIHGHFHNGKLFKGRRINVAWDVSKRLISEEEIARYLNDSGFKKP